MRDSFWTIVYFLLWSIFLGIAASFSVAVSEMGISHVVYMSGKSIFNVFFYIKALRLVFPVVIFLSVIITLSRLIVFPGKLFLSIVFSAFSATVALWFFFTVISPAIEKTEKNLSISYENPVIPSALMRIGDDIYMEVLSSGRIDEGIVIAATGKEPGFSVYEKGWFDKSSMEYLLDGKESVKLSYRRIFPHYMLDPPVWMTKWESIFSSFEDVFKHDWGLFKGDFLLPYLAWFLFFSGLWPWMRLTKWPFLNAAFTLWISVTAIVLVDGVSSAPFKEMFSSLFNFLPPVIMSFLPLFIPTGMGLLSLSMLILMPRFSKVKEEMRA
ncbi:hypothetical protein WKV44_01475 [Spirochaetia bacterium 38H-sp]|uniref:LptF/LptG family permease n=1 Tax=Rarispira pelagica TaxID=3141764 RepID=A0ABU9U959_9SPIR